MKLFDLVDKTLLEQMLGEGFVRRQVHPTLPLAILNYSEKAAYDSVWNEATLQCRGLIYNTDTDEVVARPFRKFFNHGQMGAPQLDLDAAAVVTDKLDGSLGILYPTGERNGYAVATRGSFTSDQALHATDVWWEKYEREVSLRPDWTYLCEILYPDNRIVVDYQGRDELVLLAVLDTETGKPLENLPSWPGPVVETLEYASLAEALEAEPRPNCEGLVVYFPDTDERVKIKQEDYMALHRILTGTNARNVWEVVAVKECAPMIKDPKHWGSYLGIDPARAQECLALGDEWLAEVPDEFHEWVRDTTREVTDKALIAYGEAVRLSIEAHQIEDRRERYEFVKDHPLAKEIMRLASVPTTEPRTLAVKKAGNEALASLLLRCWREATPAPTSPFARSEAIA